MLRMRVFESQSLLAAVQTAIRPVSFIGQDMAAALAGASSDTRAIDNLAAQVTARSGRRAACLGVLLARGAGASADCRAHSGAGRDGVGRAGDICGRASRKGSAVRVFASATSGFGSSIRSPAAF